MGLAGKNALVVLGPTASGKTRLAVRLAHALGDAAVLSADSRQVYRGLDIGSGKDLDEYAVDGEPVPYHLIDIAGLDTEFSVFHYQKAFFEVFENLRRRNTLPVVAGGTGLYLEAVLSGYAMTEAPENPELRRELEALSNEELAERLTALKPSPHNTSDIADRARNVRAIEIAEYTREHPPKALPKIDALVLGTRWERGELRGRIQHRLIERLDGGMIEEVERLHAEGNSWERLEWLGLEYRHAAQFLRGEIKNRNDLKQKLNAAIARFAKRQETWFRKMERNGTVIHWIDRADFGAAMQVIRGQQ